MKMPFVFDIDSLNAAEFREEPQEGFEKVKNPTTMWFAPEPTFVREISLGGLSGCDLDKCFAPDIPSTAAENYLGPLYLDTPGILEGEELYNNQFPSL